jgi:hypothetical protein
LGLIDYLAIYGAALSTAVAVWNYLRSLSKVRVVLIFAIETVDDEMQQGVGISIQNPSSQTAHITNVSFLYATGSATLRERISHVIEFKRLPSTLGWCHSSLSLHGVDDRCPVSIEPGRSHWIFVRDEVLEEVLKNARSRHLRAVVQDALWRNKYSKTFEYPATPKEALAPATADAQSSPV